MAYGHKININEMDLEYKYYNKFTAKERYIFKELIFHSSMIYNKVNKYFLEHSYNNKLQPQIVRRLSNNDSDGIYFTTQENGKIVDGIMNDWKSFFAGFKEYKNNPQKFLAKPKRPKCKKVNNKMNNVIFDDHCIIGLRGIKNKDGKKGVIRDNKIWLTLSKFAQKKFKTKYLKINMSNFKFPRNLNKNLSNLQQVRICYDKKRKEYYLAFIYRIKINILRKYNDIMSIDIGQNNLATIVFENSTDRIIEDGKKLKSVQTYINKKISKLQSIEMKRKKTSKIKYTKKMKKLNDYCRNYTWTYIHKTSRDIVNEAIRHNCYRIIIGDFKGIKQRKKRMKYFQRIPFSTLIYQIKYKAKKEGIEVILFNESYTSGCSCIDDYTVGKECYNKKRRVKRGDFKTNNGFHINADVNGAYNILRKFKEKQKLNNIPNSLKILIQYNLIITYLKLYINLKMLSFGLFMGNSALTSGNACKKKYICVPVLKHL